MLALSLAGCADDAAIDRATTVTLSTASPDLGTARDKDVAWIYHLSKSHATDDLVARLERERQQLDAEQAKLHSAGGNRALDLFVPLATPSAAPVAVTALASASTASPASSATPKPSDPLETLSTEQLDPAIVLALYHIDPVTYKKLFIENYPTTAEGVQHDYGDRLIKANLTKEAANYPIVTLARYAATSDVAAAKLYTAAAVAGGDIADRYAAVIAAYTKGHPDGFLPMLVRLDMSTRLATISEGAGWCRVKPTAVFDQVPDDQAQLALQRDLRNRLSTCQAYLRKPEKRHLADRRSNRRLLKVLAPKASAPKGARAKPPVPPA